MALTLPVVRDKEDLFQRAVREGFVELNALVPLDGVFLPGISLLTTQVRVPHRLGRPYRGFLVMDKTVTGDIWRDPTYTSRIAFEIPLLASVAMTVSLWVF